MGMTPLPAQGFKGFFYPRPPFFVGLAPGSPSSFRVMSEPISDSDPLAGASHEEVLAALFADLVVRQVNMARLFLGQAPHPETGQPKVDLEAAQMFIDQLEALEIRTRGNLAKPEEQLIKQSLTSLRLLFVQVSAGPPEAAPKEKAAATPEPQASPQGNPPAAGPAAAPESDDPKVRFSKKY